MRMMKDETIELSTSATRHGGEEVVLHGAPSWKSSNASVVSLEVSEDGMTATATAKGAGEATITASGEANEKGDDAKMEGKLEIEVEDAESMTGSMNIKVGRVGDHANKLEDTGDRHISVKERNTMDQRAAEARRAARPAPAPTEVKVGATTPRRKTAGAEETPDRLKPPFPKTGTDGKPITNV